MWTVYLLQCADDTLYCGVTNDLKKRVLAHNTLPTGAKYTKTRRPVRLVYHEECTDRSAAQKREVVIKAMSRAEKLKLVKGS